MLVAIAPRQAREQKPDRSSVIAALAIVAYVARLYGAARPEARASVASRSRRAGVVAKTCRAPALDEVQPPGPAAA
jgi:hypothetical protein